MRKQGACLTFGLVVALAISSLIAVPVPFLEKSIDEDRAVNVLDLQMLLAQVLCDSTEVDGSDINVDGDVNILDIQRLLSEATEVKGSKSEYVPLPEVLAILPAAAGFSHGILPRIRSQLSLPCVDTQSFSQCSEIEGFRPVSAYRERYLFNLTSHAPPVCA
jgi:hypothetical protein